MRIKFRFILWLVILSGFGYAGWRGYAHYQYNLREKERLKEVIRRLSADSRIAEVIVTDASYNSLLNTHQTTIKFLEYDVDGRPLTPRYFTFSGDVIQFQSLVVRFEDNLIAGGDDLRGKSAYLFWKVFRLDGKNTEEFPITPVNTVPEGYQIGGARAKLEQELWSKFWDYALHSDKAIIRGIKNAQVEAPGTKFLPGYLYTLKIEHDGGIRIDVDKIPGILRGEKL